MNKKKQLQFLSMEYLDPYPSSVPDITLIPAHFSLDKTFFVCSFIIESIFTLFVLVFLVAYIYFSCGNHKLLLDQNGNKKTEKKEAQNIICQVLQKTDYLQRLQQSSSNSSSAETQRNIKNGGSKVDLEAQLLAYQLRIFERRVVYACTYTIPWVLAVNFFASNIALIIFASAFIGLIIAFNVLRMMPNWKITLLVYFLPALASISVYLSGGISLYEWQPVVDALEL